MDSSFQKDLLTSNDNRPCELLIPNGYLSITDISNKYNYKRDVFISCINNGRLKQFVKVKKTLYINENEFVELLKQMELTYSNSYTLEGVRKVILEKTGLTLPQNNNSIIKNYFPSTFYCDLLGVRHYRVYKSDVDNFIIRDAKKYILDNKIKNEKDPFKIYDLLSITLNYSKLTFTISEYNKFAYYSLEKSRVIKIRNKAMQLHLSIKFFLQYLSKDFNILNDDELESILKKLNSTSSLNISTFLNYYKSKYPENCNYSNSYNRYSNHEEKSISSSIYTEEEWFGYLSFLTNINTHIVKAFDSQSYSRIWLYTLLHFVIALRSSDLLELPNLDILDIDKYNIKWFKNNNYTFTDAQYIINSTMLVFNNTIANKNSVHKFFVVPNPLVIPLSIAIISTEYHRRIKGNNLLGNTHYINSHFTRVFGANLNEFQNLKANKSLLTYCFNEAVDKVGYTDISYSLSSVLRSHKVNSNGFAPITQQYIYATNKNGDANVVAFHLQQRGMFGWLYKSIIDIAFDTSNCSQSDLTDLIIDLKNEVSPFSIESLSKFLQFETNEISSVIDELSKLDKTLLMELISNILNGKSPSKIDYTYCIKSNNCPYITEVNCFYCKYSIPTNYTLLLIKDELIDSLDKLNNCRTENDTDINYYSYKIFKLLRILNEAKQEFLKFDSDSKKYIDNFIQIDIIKKKLNLVKNDKLIIF